MFMEVEKGKILLYFGAKASWHLHPSKLLNVSRLNEPSALTVSPIPFPIFHEFA